MKKIHVIINPASGQNFPILNILNRVFRQAGIEWDVSLTKKSGDAKEFASRLAAEGQVDAVGVYGGDGTVVETASGLMGTGMPLAVFPGGTGNVLSVELGIPRDLTKAAELAANGPNKLRPVDVGKVGDDLLFIQRIGIGFDAQKVQEATRELKDRLGRLAYTLGGLRALRNPVDSNYKISLDGEVITATGRNAMIANTGSMGSPGLNYAEGVDVSDGLLDILVFQKKDTDTILNLLSAMVTHDEAKLRDDYQENVKALHWKGSQITFDSDPPQLVHVDGDIIGETPITVTVIPQAVQIIVPEQPPAHHLLPGNN